MKISWKKIKNKYYPYLEMTEWDKQLKKPKTISIYLGNTPKKAEKKLNELLMNDYNLSGYERAKLFHDFKEKINELMPIKDDVLSNALDDLIKIRNKYKNRIDIVEPIDNVIRILEEKL
jgi:hypothetical protein